MIKKWRRVNSVIVRKKLPYSKSCKAVFYDNEEKVKKEDTLAISSILRKEEITTNETKRVSEWIEQTF